jgi:hypothetical protein
MNRINRIMFPLMGVALLILSCGLPCHASSREGLRTESGLAVELWQGCHEIAQKSSKIVPLGAPPFCLS